MTTLIRSAPALAGTFVYVSNADDGDIGVYSVQTDGSLKPGERVKAANVVMPMAVSPDKSLSLRGGALQAVFGFRLCDRPKHGRIEDFVGIRRSPRASHTFRSTRLVVTYSARRTALT